jgi:hypothetical protein
VVYVGCKGLYNIYHTERGCRAEMWGGIYGK